MFLFCADAHVDAFMDRRAFCLGARGLAAGPLSPEPTLESTRQEKFVIEFNDMYLVGDFCQTGIALLLHEVSYCKTGHRRLWPRESRSASALEGYVAI